MAERKGFEPLKSRKALNGFQVRRIRPLCHLSENQNYTVLTENGSIRS